MSEFKILAKEKIQITPEGKRFYKAEQGLIPIPSKHYIDDYFGASLFRYSNGRLFGVCNSKGDEILDKMYPNVECCQKNFIYAYDVRQYCVFNLKGEKIYSSDKFCIICNPFVFATRNKDGYVLYDNSGNIIYENKDGLFLVKGFIEHPNYFCVSKNGKKGVIDIFGKIIVPCRFDDVDYLNGFFLVKQSDSYFETRLQGLFNFLCKELLQPKYRKIIIKDTCIIAEEYQYENAPCCLIDYGGNLLIKGLDIVCLNNGLFIYCNYQGKEGVIDSTGRTIIACKYNSINNYDQGFYYVSQKDKNRYLYNKGETIPFDPQECNRVDIDGNLEVFNNSESVWIPDDIDWSTDFVKGIAIVRKGDLLGVIDTNLNYILGIHFTSIKVYENDIIEYGKYDKESKCQFYGLTDLNGNIILPPEYEVIELISEDRFKLCSRGFWSICDTQGRMIIHDGQIKDIKQVFGNCFLIYSNNVWSLHDNCGRKIINKSYAIVKSEHSKRNGYDANYIVVAESKERINNKRYRLKNMGIIDVDGKEILPCIYNKISLYPPHYALCVKDRIFYVVDILEDKIIGYPDLHIKYSWGINENGYWLFSDDCTFNEYDKSPEGGTRGIATVEGIMVPGGIYNFLEIQKNGMIRVANTPKNVDYHLVYEKWGVLDKHGNIIVPLEYSFISDFHGDYATICLGGYLDPLYRMYGGKWGVINKHGEFVKDCIYDGESFHDLIGNADKKKKAPKEDSTSTMYDNKYPQVILSDFIPVNYARSCNYHDYDSPYPQDEPDYTQEELNDMYRDAFDGNLEYESNID